ncbi:MAG: SDR family NAD(P)-dependent oxidoreductase [Gemmatimonadaceae bacterium]|nr:SDR family NAD(P)-dependent oxidoreductase [Gemmatimonadaceae bacterium]
MNLDNQVVLLTGAAGGIGRALAGALSGAGCRLALVDRDERGLRETAAALPQTGRRVSLHVCDLADREALRALPQAVLHEHDAIHVLVNNAGVGVGGTFEQVGEEDFDWLMRVNFHAVVDLTRAVLPVLRRNAAPSRIVNVSSLYGLVSPPGQTAYSASKFAVRGFSNALRHELRGGSIGVLVVHPGGVSTGIADNARAPQGMDPAEFDRIRKEKNRLLRMPPAKAARIIVRAIEADKARVIVGFDAKVVALLERLMPVSYWRVLEWLMTRRR